MRTHILHYASIRIPSCVRWLRHILLFVMVPSPVTHHTHRYQLFVVNGNSTPTRSGLVDRAVKYLNDQMAAQAASGVGLPWTITYKHTTEENMLKEYTAIAATNLSVLGGSGCFFGVQFRIAVDEQNPASDEHLKLTLRPP